MDSCWQCPIKFLIVWIVGGQEGKGRKLFQKVVQHVNG